MLLINREIKMDGTKRLQRNISFAIADDFPELHWNTSPSSISFSGDAWKGRSAQGAHTSGVSVCMFEI